MLGSRSLQALLLPPLLLLAAATGPAGALSDNEKHVMVELHNFYRAQVTPPAANMLQMVSVPRVGVVRGSYDLTATRPRVEATSGSSLLQQQGPWCCVVHRPP